MGICDSVDANHDAAATSTPFSNRPSLLLIAAYLGPIIAHSARLYHTVIHPSSAEKGLPFASFHNTIGIGSRRGASHPLALRQHSKIFTSSAVALPGFIFSRQMLYDMVDRLSDKIIYISSIIHVSSELRRAAASHNLFSRSTNHLYVFQYRLHAGLDGT